MRTHPLPLLFFNLLSYLFLCTLCTHPTLQELLLSRLAHLTLDLAEAQGLGNNTPSRPNTPYRYASDTDTDTDTITQ